jgi:hypothetical protein
LVNWRVIINQLLVAAANEDPVHPSHLRIFDATTNSSQLVVKALCGANQFLFISRLDGRSLGMSLETKKHKCTCSPAETERMEVQQMQPSFLSNSQVNVDGGDPRSNQGLLIEMHRRGVEKCTRCEEYPRGHIEGHWAASSARAIRMWAERYG